MDPLHGTPSTLPEELSERGGSDHSWICAFYLARYKMESHYIFENGMSGPQSHTYQALSRYRLSSPSDDRCEQQHHILPRPSHGIACSGISRRNHRPCTISVRTPLFARCKTFAKPRLTTLSQHLHVFTREIDVVRWHTNIPQDPDGIPSYAQDVEFQGIRYWCDPTALGRVLKCFSRVSEGPEDFRN